jgi:hypothetical protein
MTAVWRPSSSRSLNAETIRRIASIALPFSKLGMRRTRMHLRLEPGDGVRSCKSTPRVGLRAAVAKAGSSRTATKGIQEQIDASTNATFSASPAHWIRRRGTPQPRVLHLISAGLSGRARVRADSAGEQEKCRLA